ncbi:MAG: hypothetical protein ACI91R_000116 [Vicingaceae bacterium]|jgi:hypothetical protein
MCINLNKSLIAEVNFSNFSEFTQFIETTEQVPRTLLKTKTLCS